MNWKRRVRSLAESLAARGLDQDNVGAIAAGLDDVADGLEKLERLLRAAVEHDDMEALDEAQIEVDDHLRPHLADLSRAMRHLRPLVKVGASRGTGVKTRGSVDRGGSKKTRADATDE